MAQVKVTGRYAAGGGDLRHAAGRVTEDTPEGERDLRRASGDPVRDQADMSVAEPSRREAVTDLGDPPLAEGVAA